MRGDYDGRERTLEIFNADAAEQWILMDRLDGLLDALETTAGGPVVFVFHTRAQTAELYADVIESMLREDAALDIRAAAAAVGHVAALTTDIESRQGATHLPRKAA
ncbi:MAG TPA: hypothetical protein VGM88_00230 [Kofleriaceae bacterium]